MTWRLLMSESSFNRLMPRSNSNNISHSQFPPAPASSETQSWHPGSGEWLRASAATEFNFLSSNYSLENSGNLIRRAQCLSAGISCLGLKLSQTFPNWDKYFFWIFWIGIAMMLFSVAITFHHTITSVQAPTLWNSQWESFIMWHETNENPNICLPIETLSFQSFQFVHWDWLPLYLHMYDAPTQQTAPNITKKFLYQNILYFWCFIQNKSALAYATHE